MPCVSQRRILEAAIVAEAWLEHEESSRQEVLVWRARRRDGSPGATRRRQLKPVNVKVELTNDGSRMPTLH